MLGHRFIKLFLSNKGGCCEGGERVILSWVVSGKRESVPLQDRKLLAGRGIPILEIGGRGTSEGESVVRRGAKQGGEGVKGGGKGGKCMGSVE